MGRLENHETQQVTVLPARCLVGRSNLCDLVVPSREVSSQHAVVQWTGLLWELQDLGSRNGTYLDGRRLARGERVLLQVGSAVCWAQAPGPWVLRDAGPPQPMAIQLSTGRVQVGDADSPWLISLPDADAPEVLVYREADGRWLADRDGVVGEVADRAVVDVAGEAWRMYVGPAEAATVEVAAQLQLAALRLCFVHSQDEEYIELTAHCGSLRLDLQARAHHYVLLVLARLRLADQARGVVAADQGWIPQDKLLTMLRLDASHLNITIHRARLHLAQQGVADAANLVERRKGTRQLRLGVADLDIAKLSG